MGSLLVTAFLQTCLLLYQEFFSIDAFPVRSSLWQPSDDKLSQTHRRATTFTEPLAKAIIVQRDETSPQDLADFTAALNRAGFDTMGIVDEASSFQQQEDVQQKRTYQYSFVKATGMLKLMSKQQSQQDLCFSAPVWVPVVSDKEHVLVDNGWSFLDPDESEPSRAFTAEEDSTHQGEKHSSYVPQWGQQENAQKQKQIISKLGYSLQPFTKEKILHDATHVLQNEWTRRVLLEGATDPPHRKKTHNGYDFSNGQDLATAGTFCCAIGGLPLFTTQDLSLSATAASGWLSFARSISDDHIVHIHPSSSTPDDQRIEVVCALTRCHLGHYFGREEGYCINASAMDFFLAL